MNIIALSIVTFAFLGCSDINNNAAIDNSSKESTLPENKKTDYNPGTRFIEMLLSIVKGENQEELNRYAGSVVLFSGSSMTITSDGNVQLKNADGITLIISDTSPPRFHKNVTIVNGLGTIRHIDASKRTIYIQGKSFTEGGIR